MPEFLSTVPALRQPPHDPLTLLLGGRLGWPLHGADLAVTDGSLVLPRFPGSLRRLTEPTGSLGGLRPPGNVAVTDTGDVWLLEPARARLLRLDPCSCSFVEVPCFGGTGSTPGQLDRPTGIAVAAGHLFVCDTGNKRVQVVLMPQMVVSGLWRAVMDWEPTGVVVDERFRVHVVDPLNGMVHHFGWSGRYLGNTAGVGAARHIGLGSDGTVYVAGPVSAYKIADGVAVPVTATADDLTSDFPKPLFEVADDGALHLGPLCDPPTDRWFDLHGQPTTAPVRSQPLYERSARGVIGPLDSLIDECVWHRIALRGEVPDGCGFTVDTFTAQVAMTEAEIAGLPEPAWETRHTCTALEKGSWDVLVRSPGGRYLWVRLRLFGNGATTCQLDEAVVEYPRISLRRYLPSVYGAEPVSSDFTDRLLAIFDTSLRNVESKIDDLPALFDPHATPHLDWLASWVGLAPDHRFPDSLQRAIVADSAHLLDLRGTVTGLRRLLLVALGLDHEPNCTTTAGRCAPCPPPRQTCPPQPPAPSTWEPPPLILEHFRLRRWFEAGASTLGNQTMLWGQSIVNRSQLGSTAQVGVSALEGTQDPARDPFYVYAHKFTVFVPASAGRTPERRRALERLVAWGSPAHTEGHVEYVDARLRIGVQSAIGLNTVIGRLPSGVTLGQTRLGAVSVLDGDNPQSIDTCAVGMTTVLE
ncbi:hypothetical protein RW1_051_00070 [Rhodococcus wratislaviensis NBRC 100605]|uniref:Phage tail protein n=2 Tax=Rhodococcus wratislaviensis TaxID=44752 RepID=X0PXU3_RHOWR|nr:hypothetical protein RW1_051_00070 [Rhodococcus wratislaviensis NBRC 100605]